MHFVNLLFAPARVRSWSCPAWLSYVLERSFLNCSGTGPAWGIAGEGVLLTVAEAFGNCSKYIQRRLPAGLPPGSATPSYHRSVALGARQAALVRRADTFFIASAHPERGADAPHRGGRPGFAEVADGGRRMTFPDYSGNRMFQTLGNLAVNPRTGLLFLDWETGTTLQLTGRSRIIWDPKALRSGPGLSASSRSVSTPFTSRNRPCRPAGA